MTQTLSDPWSELAEDMAPVAREAMTSLTEILAEAERRGYFGFARSGMGVVDKVVTSFSEEDVRALGDNIVLILETIRQMTQPEVMQMLRRTVDVVGEAEPVEPPSLFALLKELREPRVRRGLARVISMLRSVGADAPTARR
jgi:uncharacterized protein YjgD (DUF1641 family)